MVSETDRIEIERLLSLKVADMGDKDSAQTLIKRYINQGAHYCFTCAPQVRQMFKVLKNWWDDNKDK